MTKMIDIPPVWLALFVLAAWLQPRILPVAPRIDGAFAQFLGGSLVGAGVLLVIFAAIEFRKHKTTIVPHLQPNALITTGIFAQTRNPIYLADVLILTGLTLRFGAALALLLVPLFVFLLDRRFIRAEEARLAKAFGPAFETYCAQTRRWV